MAARSMLPDKDEHAVNSTALSSLDGELPGRVRLAAWSFCASTAHDNDNQARDHIIPPPYRECRVLRTTIERTVGVFGHASARLSAPGPSLSFQ